MSCRLRRLPAQRLVLQLFLQDSTPLVHRGQRVAQRDGQAVLVAREGLRVIQELPGDLQEALLPAIGDREMHLLY